MYYSSHNSDSEYWLLAEEWESVRKKPQKILV